MNKTSQMEDQQTEKERLDGEDGSLQSITMEQQGKIEELQHTSLQLKDLLGEDEQSVKQISTESESLAESLEAAASQVKEQVLELQGLNQRINGQFSEVADATEHRFSDFDAMAVQLHDGVNERWEKVSSGFESVKKATQQLQEKIEEIGHETKSQIDALKEKRESMSRDLASDREKAQQLSQELKHQLQVCSEAAQQNMEMARQQIEASHRLAEEAKNSIQEQKAHLIDQFVEFEGEIKKQLDAYPANFQNVITRSHNALGVLEREMEGQAGRDLTEAEHYFGQTLISRLNDAGSGLQEALNLLDSLSNSKAKEISDEIGGTVSDINDVIRTIREILPYLEPVLALF